MVKEENDMPDLRVEISKEIYENAMKNNGCLTNEDRHKVFNVSELYGYGVYGAYAREKDGKYYCFYYRGETCD